jgi:hypothetical protein
MASKESAKDIIEKYGSKIENQLGGYNPKKGFSQSYQNFRGAMQPALTPYEKKLKSFGNFIKLKISEKDTSKIQKNLDVAHLNVTPSEVAAYAIVIMITVLFGGIFLGVAGWLLFTDGAFSSFPIMWIVLVLFLSIFLFYYEYTAPSRLAMKWRLKASSQMVPAILYIVIYMKHTSNLEKAVAFAAEHLDNPLGLDFKKVFWDVEIGRYSNLKSSLDAYLESWRDYFPEFIESFHLIESSLFEPSEERRVEVLEKSLQVMLDGVYDKMLKYTHDVKAPLTNLYMLGIVLPTLALAILPLASTMLQGAIKWYHVFVIFNLLIPFFVIFMTNKVMMSRPGGYGESNLWESNPLYSRYNDKKANLKGFFVALPFFIVGILPLVWTYFPINEWLNVPKDFSIFGFDFFGIVVSETGTVGPLSPFSLILSLLIPLSIALYFIVSYDYRTRDLIVEREKYKAVESEFTSSLFQLGNRLGDGIPAEIAFAKVADSTRGTHTEGFFKIVNENIQQLGMSVERALFDPKRGAVIFYPSQLISTSMKILVESVKKGLKVAARSLMSISDYVKNIRKINDRLNDLLAEITSDMKSNMTFLAPLLSGIIVGLTGMITVILVFLGQVFESGLTEGGLIGGFGNVAGIMNIFDVSQMLSPYLIQFFIGLYLIEIVFILSSTLVTIRYGKDDIKNTNETGVNLKRSIILYVLVSFISTLVLSLIARIVVSGLG